MSQVFPRSMNLIVTVVLVTLVLLVGGLAAFGYYIVRSPLMTGVGVAHAQPAPFSHQQHVGGLGLDCRYCHTAVEVSNTASIPPTATCMGCHAQVATAAPTLDLVRASFEENQPLEWIRVHSLPDYVYFNHAIHVRQGIGCESCHGRVDQMPTVGKVETLSMAWCLDCHRAPENHVRPREAVFVMGWAPPIDQATLGQQLVAEHGIQVAGLADCSVCHR